MFVPLLVHGHTDQLCQFRAAENPQFKAEINWTRVAGAGAGALFGA